MEDNKAQGSEKALERIRKMNPLKVKIVERPVEVDGFEYQGVFSYDWDRDIQETPPPPPTVRNSYVDKDQIDSWWPLCIGPDKWYGAVRADPNDEIQLEMEDGERKSYHAHAGLWHRTIDTYLYAYYLLQEKKAAGEFVELGQSDEANELLRLYYGRSKKRRKKLPLICRTFEMVTRLICAK